jgi:hypothetical protein
VFALERSLSLASSSVVAFLKPVFLLFLENLFDLVFIELMEAGSYLCSAGAELQQAAATLLAGKPSGA